MLRPLTVFLELGADRERISHTINLAQRHDDSPLWETSMLPEKFRDGRLPGDLKLRVGPGEPEGLAHLVQHYKLAPGERIQLFASAGMSASAARASFEESRSSRAAYVSEASWRRYFAGVPQFESSDPWLTSAYWYRWYGLRLNTVDMPDLPICGGSATFSPFVTEGIGFFRNFVTYSAQAHLREVSWMHDPRLAAGILDNLAKCQRADGSFPGHNYSCRPSRDFYHADFTRGLLWLKFLHGDEAVPAGTWPALERYAEYFLNQRAQCFPEHRALLFLVLDQNETGQEYMSRYTAIRSDADQWASFQVCGVDASAYAGNLFRFLAAHLYEAKDNERSSRYADLAGQVRQGLAELCWDPERRFFCDVRIDGSRTDAHPATGLYPSSSSTAYLLWHNDGLELDGMLRDWLENPSKFDLPMGFPADAADDATFSSDAEWKDKRLNCPWNGRSWPMVNAHLVDCAAHFARVWCKELPSHEEGRRLKQAAGEALMKTVKLMFHHGDPSRPNSYEHYNPVTGIPALYRGYDDYMHSWIVDLILRHAVGIEPGRDDVDPLPLDIEWIECCDIPHPRGRMHVRLDRGRPAQVSIEEVS